MSKLTNIILNHLPKEQEELDFELPADMEFGRQRVMDYRIARNEVIQEIIKALPEIEEEIQDYILLELTTSLTKDK